MIKQRKKYILSEEQRERYRAKQRIRNKERDSLETLQRKSENERMHRVAAGSKLVQDLMHHQNDISTNNQQPAMQVPLQLNNSMSSFIYSAVSNNLYPLYNLYLYYHHQQLQLQSFMMHQQYQQQTTQSVPDVSLPNDAMSNNVDDIITRDEPVDVIDDDTLSEKLSSPPVYLSSSNYYEPPLTRSKSSKEIFPKYSTLSPEDREYAKQLGVKSLHIKGWLFELPDDVQEAILSLFKELVTTEYNTKKGCHIRIDAPYNTNHAPKSECRKVLRHLSAKNMGPIVDGCAKRASYGSGSGRHSTGGLEE